MSSSFTKYHIPYKPARFDPNNEFDCVLVCKDKNPITTIAGVDGDYIYVGTTGTDIKKWVNNNNNQSLMLLLKI